MPAAHFTKMVTLDNYICNSKFWIFKVANSARAFDGGDDFLGSIDIPVRNLPATGLEQWYKLEGTTIKTFLFFPLQDSAFGLLLFLYFAMLILVWQMNYVLDATCAKKKKRTLDTELIKDVVVIIIVGDKLNEAFN